MSAFTEFQAEQERLQRKVSNAQREMQDYKRRRVWNKVLLAAAVLTFLALAVGGVMGW